MAAAEDTRKLFLTGIPLEATLSECLSALRPFGKVTHFTFYPKEGPHSDRAFVDFADPESGAACLAKSRSTKALVSDKLFADSSIIICGAPIVAMIRKDRDVLLQKRGLADKRNQHLMYEGRIVPGDPAAEGVSDAEMAKRKKLFEKKLEKMADTNNKVSRTRLAVFNIPPGTTTGQIRKIFAVAPKQYARTHKTEELSRTIMKTSVRIGEVRKPEGQDDVAFVEFTQHEHALGALRIVNNNPKYFDGQRLIVEFAIENSNAIRKRKKKEEDRKKMRAKRFAGDEPSLRGDEDDSDEE